MTPAPPKVDILGVGVTAASKEALVRSILDSVRRRGSAMTVAAVNVHTWTEARRNPAYAEALRSSDIAWPDGMPVVWLSRRLGRPTGERVRGQDLMRLLLREPVGHYFYGSTPDVLSDLERNVRAEFPGVRIAGVRSPPFTKKPALLTEEEIGAIERSGADILWVALGAPKQELWMELNRNRVRVSVMVGVGAAFEMFAGRFRSAPRFLQALGLEWTWRLSQDPARLWRRYLSTNGHFLSAVVAHALGRRA